MSAHAGAQDREPGPIAALSDVVEFLRTLPPFDALSQADVERVAASTEIEFFPAGSTIFSQGAQPVEHLRVVRTGAVEIVLAGRVLDLLAAGELFGHSSMLSGLPPGFAARALEDTLCYRIPQEVARSVLARPESVGFVARSLLEMHASAPTALTQRRPDGDPSGQPVGALIRDPPVLCSPQTSIRRAAEMMTAAGASAVVLLALAIVSYRQIGYWNDEFTVWTHAAEVNKYHWLARDNVAALLWEQGKPLEAQQYFRQAAAINPDDSFSNMQIGYYEQATGNLQGAIAHYQHALKDQSLPDDTKALLWRNMGVAYRNLGDRANSLECFRQSASFGKH